MATTTTAMLPMSQPFNWQLEDYAYFRKCGEITTSPDVQCFGFNCAYCPAICLHFDVFLEHIRGQHVQDVRRRYEGVDEKIEQATQTDLMIMDMHMDNGVDMFQIENNGLQTETTTMTNTRLDKRVKKSNWYDSAMATNTITTTATTTATTTTQTSTDTQRYSGMGLLEVDMASFTVNSNSNSVTALQLPATATEATTTTTTNTPTTEIDFVYIMENPLPLPPSPPLSLDISGDERSAAAALQSIDPFEMLPTALPTSLPTSTSTPLRYETRRVALQRKMRAAENETTTEQQQQQQQQLDEFKQLQLEAAIVVELTPPSTPPTPAAPTSPASSDVSSDASSSSVRSGASTKLRSRRELERNREFVGSLLLAYERHEKLWNPKHPEYKYNAKRSIYGELAAPLESAFQMPLTGAEIFAVLKELRGRYRRELSKLNALGGKFKSRLWYFDRMHFLRGVIEHKRAEREAKSASDSTESEKSCETDTDCSKSAQYREVLSFIVDAFRQQECLWNPQHLEYANCPKKELYREISAQLLEQLNYELSGEECHKEIQKLRTRYRKELRMVINHKGLYLPKLWCYDELEFLHKILQDQIFNKISKKVGVVETTQKTKFINANCIVFASQDDHLQFVEIYRNYPALWDVDHPDFRSNAYRSQALSQMLDELNNTFQSSHSSAQLEKTLFELRKDFSAQKRKMLTNPSCTSSSLVHAQLSQFLEQNLGPFRCDVCAQLVKTCDQYKVHRSGHDGTQPFICTLCGKGFQMPCNLTVHIRRHRRDFPYACEQCDKRFATSTEVAIHMRTHTGERPYICDLCGKSFKTWSFFDIHRRTHLNQSTFHCPICDKGFYEKNRFTDHMNGHLNIRKHLCTVCGKTFTTYGNLKKHAELHLAVKKYKCSSCDKRFAQFASLRWHRKREHGGEAFEP